MAAAVKRKTKKLADVLKECRISEQEKTSPRGTVINKAIDPALVAKWPPLKMKVPALFLHKPVDFEVHARELLKLEIKFYRPYTGRYLTKVSCPTFADQRSLAQYLDKNKLPYHTYGHPTKRKMKVVIKGLPNETNLDIVKEELKFMSIPFVRIHKMHTKDDKQPLLILAVLPYSDEGKRIFLLRKILGSEVQLEPPKPKAKQCHRCQKWGHAQRYCHGHVKCVKCAGDHFSKKCTRDPTKEPVKCANCLREHTASFRQCSHCPDSTPHKTTIAAKKTWMRGTAGPKIPKLVSLENIDMLYKNIGYFPKCTSKAPEDEDVEDEEEIEIDYEDMYDMIPSDVDEIDYDDIY